MDHGVVDVLISCKALDSVVQKSGLAAGGVIACPAARTTLFFFNFAQDIMLTTYVMWERESCGDDRAFLKR